MRRLPPIALALALAALATRADAASSAPSTAPAPRPDAVPSTSTAPAPQAAAGSETLDIVQARSDLDRGVAILTSKKRPRRVDQADASFTAVIDRLTPSAEAIDAEGRLVLARALDGRAQTSLLRGRARAADEDFARLVSLEPAYEPDPSLASRQALDRFRKIRATRVAYVSLRVDPVGATITWNGRELGVASGIPAELPVLAGPYTVHARSDCYEDKEIVGDVTAAEKRLVTVTLDPLARVVRFVTRPPGFDVEVDGTFAGRTAAPVLDSSSVGPQAEPSARPLDDDAEARPETGRVAGRPADESSASPEDGVLDLACLATGDHAYTVRKDCYADVRGTLSVEVDLLDKTPLVVPLIAPRKRETRLSVTSDTPEAVLLLDDKPAGPLPVRDLTLCPARVRMDARVGERIVWTETRDLEDGPMEIAARRRPTLAVVGLYEIERMLGAPWAAEIRKRAASLGAFNVVGLDTSNHPNPSPDRVGTNSRKPEDARLAADLRLEAVPMGDAVSGPEIGMKLVPPSMPHFTDATDVEFAEVCGSPEEPEDRACYDRFFAGLEVEWKPGARRAGAAPGAPATPAVDGLPGALGIEPPGALRVPLPRAIATTLLDVDVLPAGAERNASLMTLASALIGAGAHREALEKALERPGWAEGVRGFASSQTAAFLAGICHQALGEDEAARAAFGRAAVEGGGTLWTADGLPVAPLARFELRSPRAGKPPLQPAPAAPRPERP